ncbi:hypothetical protein K438DRAFT_1934039 [Mycena galopus ATCC 62051]|nr:hypothetical protein K438DRAFT_1934039 [Mycena galopus ATCC 62051]
MSDSRLYTRLLLPKGHGYPLFHPQAFDDLPLELRRVGTEIGDVGVVTSDGSFDPIFNICRAADDPLNRFGVPPGFEQVNLQDMEVSARDDCHEPGSDVSSAAISKRRLDIDAGVESNVFLPLSAGAVVEISAASTSKEAAILLLPEGGSRVDLRSLKKFRDYAVKHAQHWYDFVNRDLERIVGNGDLYLVTGTDKSSSWGVAALENRCEDGRVSLKLKAAQTATAGASCTWEWETATSFARSGPRRPPEEASWGRNQTIFLRGYKVVVRPYPLMKLVKAISIVNSKPGDILRKSTFIPSLQSRSLGARNSTTTSTTGRAPPFYSSSAGTRRTSGDDECKVYHPSSAVNQFLLDFSPDATVALIHDNQWMSVLNEDDHDIPTESEFIRRICDKYTIANTLGGAWLQDSTDHGPCSEAPGEPVVSSTTASFCNVSANCEPQRYHLESGLSRDAFVHRHYLFCWLQAIVMRHRDAFQAVV